MTKQLKTWEDLEKQIIGIATDNQPQTGLTIEDRSFALECSNLWIRLTIESVSNRLPGFTICRTAPDLLAACKRLVEYAGMACMRAGGPHTDDSCPVCSARSAIAKAEVE